MGVGDDRFQPVDAVFGGAVNTRRIVWLRRISQVLFFLLFIVLLIKTALPQNVMQDYSTAMSAQQGIRLNYPVSFFFKLDPLLWISTVLASHRWIAGTGLVLGIVVMTLVLGRFFCGFVCPFGTLHHAIAAVHPAVRGRKAGLYNEKTPAQRIKYAVLTLVLISAVFGLNLAGFFDPLSVLFRTLAVSILPAINIGVKEVFDAMASSNWNVLNLISYSAEMLISPILGFGYPAYQTGFLIGVIGIAILMLNRVRSRFWCRVLCPLGALLGCFSFKSPLQLVQDASRCTGCGKCMEACQGAASPRPGLKWENAECVRCFNCQAVCPEDALSFQMFWHQAPVRLPDTGRREVLTGLVAGVAFPFLSRLDGQIYHTSDARLIRPPGSLSEALFLERCQRCGLCMKVCPTNAIQPSLTEAGVAGFWTPVLHMTTGYCEYTCTLCGSVCPTGAIRMISEKEKTTKPVRIGSAFIDRGKCLPWSGNAPCIMCQEVCPVSPKAVEFREAGVQAMNGQTELLKQPYVNLQRCVGCGSCENKCPVKGAPAIRVIAAGESRSERNQILLNG